MLSSMLALSSAHAPLGVVAMWGDITLEDVERMRAFYEHLHTRGERFATLVDGRHVGVPPSPIRRALAEMTSQFAGRAKLNTVSVATIIDSKVLIGVLSAIRWFIKDEQPFAYHATAVAGLKWTEGHLAQENLTVPEAARRLVTKLDRATPEQLPAVFAED